MSGYTGAGKKGIAQYEDKNRDKELDSPRIYALTQQHKHLKEMKAISNLSKEPIFTPIICDYPQGMLVNIPLYTDKMSKNILKRIFMKCLPNISTAVTLSRSDLSATARI